MGLALQLLNNIEAKNATIQSLIDIVIFILQQNYLNCPGFNVEESFLYMEEPAEYSRSLSRVLSTYVVDKKIPVAHICKYVRLSAFVCDFPQQKWLLLILGLMINQAYLSIDRLNKFLPIQAG